MKILKKIFQVIVKIINHCVPVDSRSLYFIPHPNCRTDKYDIINYSSDNVLVLLNYLLKKDSAEYYMLKFMILLVFQNIKNIFMA